MLQEIRNQIDNINQSLAWIRKNKEEDYYQRFLQLVDNRRTLKKIESAIANNPGIAAFGKSQVGKSYLISCLLQGRDRDGKDVPFMVRAGNESYNFIYKINPPSEKGGGKESTGVVSRFSSFSRDETLYNADLPILIKTFSVTDIIMILSDSYFNDFSDYTTPGETEIKDLCDSWEDKYKIPLSLVPGMVSADDILNIKFYFEKHINNAQTYNKSAIFDKLALVIDKIPTSDYAEVFSNLWNKEPVFTRLFTKLVSILQRFNFSETLYLPIQSVLHEGIKENTIMSVQCLMQLFQATPQYTCDVYLRENGQFTQCASAIPKSEMCAICSEVVYKIDQEFLSSSRPYKWENMDAEVQPMITHDPVKMEMFADNDLLDFPGARSRQHEKLVKVSKANNILDFFLRGKVAYLFNKYNEEMGINILLYCHHNKDNEVNYLYELLEDWVCNYVGRDCHERQEKLAITKKSPLFNIGTMFNLDMEMNKGTEMTEKSIDQRWIGRFETVVNKQCFHRETVDWVKNWTREGEDFNNSYVLRDYKFSTNLFDGFEECGCETGSKMSDAYYQMMRKTFVENEHVKKLFANPRVAWDVASTQGNDGALYIIESLSDVADTLNEARESDIKKILHRVRTQVYNIMKGYFVSTDVNGILEEHVRKANAVFREMDFTCNSDNYYFGHLIQALQLKESSSYRIVHKIMQSPELNKSVNEFKDYEIITNSCAKKGFSLEKAQSEEEKWNCLIKTYMFENMVEADAFLKHKHVEVQRLFTGSYRRKLNSCIIADTLYEKWCSLIKSVDFLNEFSDENSFDNMVMSNLVENLITASVSIDLKDKMAEAIADYVNVIDVHTANENLLADMLASIVNEFVLDFGFSWLSDEEKEKAKKVCDMYNLPTFNYILKEPPVVSDEATLAAMFNEMSSNPKALLPSFDDNYNKWLEYMFISFVAHVDVPEVDPVENNKVKTLLDNIKVAV